MVESNYARYLLAVTYAFIFVYFIPWVEFKGSEFHDISNYIERIIYLKSGGDEAKYWGIGWIFSEPLWKQIVIFIGDTFQDYRAVIYGLSFIVTFIYISFLLKRVEFYVAMIFLFNPMTVNLFMEQIRIAMAFSLILLAYGLIEKKRSVNFLAVLLLLMAPFIHSAIIVFYGIFYLLYKLNKIVEEKKYYLIAIGTALFLALFMKYSGNIILVFIGDRRANYYALIEASSLSYSIAWFMIAMVVGTFAQFKDSNNRVIVAYAITIMSFFFFSSLLDVFAARYVAVIMPFIIISIAYLPKHIKQGTYLFLFAYNIFSFKYWLKLTIL